MNFRLQRHRMNTIGMEALPNRLGQTVEIADDVAVENDVRRGKRFGLVQSPDVQLVHG
jgi:hypothetical protein